MKRNLALYFITENLIFKIVVRPTQMSNGLLNYFWFICLSIMVFYIVIVHFNHTVFSFAMDTLFELQDDVTSSSKFLLYLVCFRCEP